MLLPVKVKLNTTSFPVHFITITARPKRALGGLSIEYTNLSDTLKARSGDGIRPKTLSPSRSIDIFVRDHQPPGRWPADYFDDLEVISISRGSPAMIRVRWETINNRAMPGEFSLVWSYEDRAADLRPFILIGDASEALAKYSLDDDRRVSGSSLGLQKRINQATRLDIRRHARQSRIGGTTGMDSFPYSHARSISVEGFRGFREAASLRLAQPQGIEGSGLTFVVGANNAGKSTIWESFDAISRKLKNDVSFSAGRRNRGTTDGIRIKLEFDEQGYYQVLSRKGDTSETKDEWSSEPPHVLPEIVTVPSRRQFQATFARNGVADRDWMAHQTEFTRFRQNDQFTGRLFDLHNDEEKKEKFDRLMTEVLGQELNWTIDLGEGQYGQSYYLKVTTGSGVDHSSEGLGDGIVSLLFVLNALYDSEPQTLLVLDEPELSLHPQLVKRLGRVLARFAKDRQIVCLTHSPHLISWGDISSGAEIARVYKSGADSRIAQPTRSTTNSVASLRRGWRTPHILGIEANEVFFLDDGVILVEGQEDAALFPRVFEQAGVAMDGTIFGWGSGGAGNVAKLAALLQELGYERVAVVLDDNVPGIVTSITEAFPKYLVTEIPAADIRDKKAQPSVAVTGLLDERGRNLKPELKEQTHAVLASVRDYLRNRPSISGTTSQNSEQRRTESDA